VTSAQPATPADEQAHEAMSELAEQARRACRTAGVAVYLKGPGESRFRASVSWTADEPVPDIPYHLPRVFSWILEHGEALISPDLEAHPPANMAAPAPRDVRGLAAVPIIGDDRRIIGTICVFDVKPFVLDRLELDALKAIGAGVSVQPSVAPARPAARPGPVRVVASAAISREDSHGAVSVGPPELLDRRTGSLAISRELARQRRERHHLSLVLFDVDAREAAVGPPLEERASDPISSVSNTVTKAIRGSDLAIRWSRGELLVVLPGLNEMQARHVAERVRAGMQAGSRHRLVVSGGVAELLTDDTFESAVIRANEKVRLARELGHSRIG
jgi:diguanylate cyclase (GGDEF)-like protein